MSIKGNYFSDKMYGALFPFKIFFDNPATPDDLYDSKLKESEKIINDLLEEFESEDYNIRLQGRIVRKVFLTKQTQLDGFTGRPVRSVNVSVS